MGWKEARMSREKVREGRREEHAELKCPLPRNYLGKIKICRPSLSLSQLQRTAYPFEEVG
jgi:hypothetical protein